MKNIILSILTILTMLNADFSAASTFDFVASPKKQTKTTQVDDSTQLAQRGFWGRRNNFNRNFQRQQQQRRMQQQRLQQQRLQRQRMEQRRRQQAQQRQRQMQAARAKQRQTALQRQQAIQQKRLAQTRQRQEAQRKQGQQALAAKNKSLQNQRLAKKQIQDQQRLRRLKQLRERDQKLKIQKQQQKRSDVTAFAALRTAKSVSALKTPLFKKRIEATRSNLQKVKTQQLKLSKKATEDLNKSTQKVAKIAALKSKLKCGNNSCYGNDLKGGNSNLITSGVNKSKNDFPRINPNVSVQKQNRHVSGTKEYAQSGKGGAFNNIKDAQKVLTAYHKNQVKIIGQDKHGNPIVKFDKVTGFHNNVGAKVLNQTTTIFKIKGTKRPSIVPINPNWTQK